MIATGLCLLATRALNILTPRQLGIVVTLLGASKQKALEALAIYVVLIWISSYSGIKAVQRLLWVPVMTNAQVSLQCASYDHIMDLSCDFHDEKQSGDLYTAMGQGDTLVDLLDTILLDCLPIVIDLTLALVYFYILFDTYLVLIGAATIVLYLWTFISLMDIAMKIHRKRVVAGRKQQAILYDTMGEWRTVTYFNRIPFAKQLYSSGVALTQRFRVQLQYLWAFGFGMNELTLQIGGAAAFFFAAYQVIYIGKDVGSFVTLTSYWWTFTEPIHQIARIHRDILSNLVKAEELLTLFRTRPSIQDGPNEMQITEGKVVFDEAGFHYAGKDSFIKDLSFVANSGKTIALIGETGAGKSTILKLLFRFYDLTEGSISIDGQDIRNVSLSSLRQHIGVVPQDASLFNDTVLANVRFARLEATEDEVKKACEAAAIHDRIMGFPEGYQTKVGEKGQKLSGGELQRIAIARAILKNPKIILLDEATSSVDNETEVKIQAGLNKLCQGRTTFVVAHRLSTIMDADMILVIGDGKIIEQGAPADLLKKKGKYYKLWSKQMGIMDVLEKADESDTIVGGTTPAGTSIETIPGGGEEEDDDYYSDDIDDFDSEEDEDEGEYEKVKAESEENIKQQRESQDKQTVRGKRGNGIDKQSQSNTLEVTEKTKRNNEGNGKEESSGVAGTTSAKEVQSRAGNARRRRQRAVRSQQVPNVVVDSGPPLSAGESLGKEEPPAPAPTPAAGVPEKNGGAIPDDLTPLIHHP
jgi:ABC-type transport system involved in Fe-S cluster assembly fused permease/ATPase subunit